MIFNYDFCKIAQIIALFLFIPVFYYMYTVYKIERKWKLFTIAFGFLLISTIFAILREFYSNLFDVFRGLEWLCILIASIIFAYTCYYSHVYLRAGMVK